VNQNQGGVMAFLAGALICVGIFLLIILGIYIFFCVSMQRTMSAIKPKNRQFAPGLVWLHMLHLGGAVPFIGILFSIAAAVWDLFMVLKIAESLRKEYKSRGWRIGKENFGKSTGLVWTIGNLLGLPVGFVIGFLSDTVDQDLMGIVSLALVAVLLGMFVCFIIYWVQIHGLGTKLREAGGGRRRTAEEDDYDDDYQPRGRSRRRADEDEDDDDAPRSRRRRADDDDDEDRPRRRRPVDDEDEDDRPRRRRRDEDDD
jgi:hypothetical protein